MLINYSGESLNDIQSKADKLRGYSQTDDINTQLELWKETLYFRRQSIRDRSTAEILEEFPGYSNKFFVS